MKKILFILGCLLTVNSYGQSGFDKVVIKTHQINDRTYMLKGAGGNIGLYLGPDEALIVDSQFAQLSDKIVKAIREITDLPIKWLVNTHWHGDHTGGNANFANQGSSLIAHENVLTRLTMENLNSLGKSVPPPPEVGRSDLIYQEEMMVKLAPDQRVMVRHVHNAHTDGDSFVYFLDENVLHMGDCFFNGFYPYIDLNSKGSVEGYVKAVELAIMMINDDTVIIPGHGEIANKSDLLTFYIMLKKLIGRMGKALQNTTSVEDIDVSEITKGYKGWGDFFITDEQIVKILFLGLR